MAFREPTGFAPTALRRRANPTKKRAAKRAMKSAGKPGKARRRVALVGGTSRNATSSGTAKEAKETRPMAKKRRTAAQKAATKKMLAANKARAKGKSKPRKTRKVATAVAKAPAKRRARRSRKVRAAAPAVVKQLKHGSSLRVRSGRKLSKAASKFKASVVAKTRRGRNVTRTYRKYKSGKLGMIIRENPANYAKAVVSAAAGFGVGIIGADVLDRFVATRAPKGEDKALSGQRAIDAINKPADGVRIFAQAAGTGVSAVGAYLLRKNTIGAYLLGGMAAAFAAKAVGMIVKDHLMPALLPAKGKEADSINQRLVYGPLAGPRGYMGYPRPFPGKSTPIGPQATGSVGAYGCTRVPVNPSAYYDDGQRQSCKPWPFSTSEAQHNLEVVSQAPGSSTLPIQPQVERTVPRGEIPAEDINQPPSIDLSLIPRQRQPISMVPSIPGGGARVPTAAEKLRASTGLNFAKARTKQIVPMSERERYAAGHR